MSKRFERLKAELERAFSAPESSYTLLTADEVIARNKRSVAEPLTPATNDDAEAIQINNESSGLLRFARNDANNDG